ncbi:MAG: SDR family oxidoreductase [Kineosporiaceae bacterium]
MAGRVALVTGAAQGIGEAVVRLFAAEGAAVVAGDVNIDGVGRLASGLGDRVRGVRLDVTSEADWSAAVAAAEESFGPLTALVNNAGVVDLAPLEATAPEVFRRVVDVNLTGTFLGIRAAVPALRRAGGGTVVNISSAAGMIAVPGMGACTASKWGVRGLTRTAALEVARDGIRVNSVHPGPIETPMTAVAPPGYTDAQPIDRFGRPDEVARTVLFLSTDDSSYTTGGEFVVDGGVTTGSLPRRQAPTG